MPMIMVETSIAAGASNSNLYTGSAFEFARSRGVVSIGIAQSATGMFATLQAGADIICEEFSLPILTRFPIIPDEMYFTDVVEAGDRLVARVRNPTGGALTARSVVQMSAGGWVFGPISTLPQMLPQLFGLTGQAIPKSFAEYIQPTMELLDLLAANNCMETLTAVQNLAAPGLARDATLTVPPTEAWLVKGAGFVLSTGVAEVYRGKLVVGRVDAGGSHVLRQLSPVAYSDPNDVAGAASAYAGVQGGAFLLYANDFIGVASEKVTTAGLIACTINADVYRFNI